MPEEVFTWTFYDILKIMKEFWKKIWGRLVKSKIFWIALIIIVQTIVYVVAGMGKNYFHMDEMYSYGLANYDRVQIYENDDFYNEWHDADYYKDYIVVNEDERGDFAPVYNNQRDDVHPPLYYLLLRLGMEMMPGEFTKWSGIVINIMAFAVSSVFLYLIAEKLVRKQPVKEIWAFVITLVAALSLASISTVMYIRMYAMLTMFVTITLWLHLKLAESKKLEWKLLVPIAMVALLGVLTQYYYVFFLLPLFIMMVVRYAKAHRTKGLWMYVAALAVAALMSIIIWPYSIQHMFFGYRGVGVMGNLLNFAHLGEQVGVFFGMLALYAFHYLLPFMLIAMFALAIYGLKHGKSLKDESRDAENYSLVLWPTVVFFLIASVASPFQDLRYIEPICGLAILAAFYGVYRLVGMVSSAKVTRRVMLGLCALMLVLPIPLRIEPNVEYSRFKELTQYVAEKKDVPAIFLYNPANERILDDLTLFTEIEESYVMHHQEYTEKNFDEVLRGKDLSKGLLVFANYGDGNEQYLKVLREATGLVEQDYIFRTNSADLYYLHK